MMIFHGWLNKIKNIMMKYKPKSLMTSRILDVGATIRYHQRWE